MFLIKTLGIAIITPFVLSLFFLIKEKVIQKKEIIFRLIQKSDPKSLSLINLLAAFLMTFIVMFGLFFTLGVVGISSSNFLSVNSIAAIIVYFFLGTIIYMMTYTHKIHKYRVILFLLFAVGFSIDFICDMYEARGHFMVFTNENMIQGELPKCHIALIQSIIPAVFKKTMVFPGKISQSGFGIRYTIGSIIMLWIAGSLIIGRGWCSWLCFYGGWDDGFSSMKKKPMLKCNPNFKLFPLAILIVVVLSSLIFLTPTYCFWLCPFKAVTESAKINSIINVIQLILFFLLFIGLAVVLPILTKKRTQCTFLCPFGFFQSLVDKINIFRVRINKEKCINCKLCIKECPVMSITEKTLEKGKVGLTCTKCGKCIDICPENAISYHIKGTSLGGKSANLFSFVSRYIFLLVALVFFGTLGGGEIRDGLFRIILFITTGRFVK